jgi:four helix bundle protein
MKYKIKTSNAELPTFSDEWKDSADGVWMFGEEATQYDLEERLLEFAVQIIRLVEKFPATRAGNHVPSQLLRSGTSPLPNHGEAQAAESRRDFVHKLRISLKELRETCRWLKLTKRVPLVTPPYSINPVLDETEQLIKIFAASIRTASAKNKTMNPRLPDSTLNVQR